MTLENVQQFFFRSARIKKGKHENQRFIIHDRFTTGHSSIYLPISLREKQNRKMKSLTRKKKLSHNINIEAQCVCFFLFFYFEKNNLANFVF